MQGLVPAHQDIKVYVTAFHAWHMGVLRTRQAVSRGSVMVARAYRSDDLALHEQTCRCVHPIQVAQHRQFEVVLRLLPLGRGERHEAEQARDCLHVRDDARYRPLISFLRRCCVGHIGECRGVRSCWLWRPARRTFVLRVVRGARRAPVMWDASDWLRGGLGRYHDGRRRTRNDRVTRL